MERHRATGADRPTSRRGLTALVLSLGVAMLLVTGAGALGQTLDPGCVPNEADGSCLPVAAESARVDLTAPSFSHPTAITNPLFPIGEVPSVLMLGHVDGEPFRTEVTLLPETKTIVWNGQPVETLVSQYVAYLDGRIHEVALDWYAQADDGSVWYFGEDVFNYEDGVVADTHGTWIAGTDHLPGMIMPADPQVGDVYRPENIPGLVFEEVTVTAIDVTVDGPHGPVAGAIVVSELHQDGTTEEKIFAPGYGEFRTGGGGDLEAVALAVPTDALPGLPAAELDTLSTGAEALFDAVQAEQWDVAAAAAGKMGAAWETYSAGDVPEMIASQMTDALGLLDAAVAARDGAAASQAALDVAEASLDLQLRHLHPAEIDLARLDLQAHQLILDAAADDSGAVAGDVTTLEWMWDRVSHTVAPSPAEQIGARLSDLRVAADAEDLPVATEAAVQICDLLAKL